MSMFQVHKPEELGLGRDAKACPGLVWILSFKSCFTSSRTPNHPSLLGLRQHSV